jgi:hypothetical protein
MSRVGAGLAFRLKRTSSPSVTEEGEAVMEMVGSALVTVKGAVSLIPPSAVVVVAVIVFGPALVPLGTAIMQYQPPLSLTSLLEHPLPPSNVTVTEVTGICAGGSVVLAVSSLRNPVPVTLMFVPTGPLVGVSEMDGVACA